MKNNRPGYEKYIKRELRDAIEYKFRLNKLEDILDNKYIDIDVENDIEVEFPWWFSNRDFAEKSFNINESLKVNIHCWIKVKDESLMFEGFFDATPNYALHDKERLLEDINKRKNIKYATKFVIKDVKLKDYSPKLFNELKNLKEEISDKNKYTSEDMIFQKLMVDYPDVNYLIFEGGFSKMKRFAKNIFFNEYGNKRRPEYVSDRMFLTLHKQVKDILEKE